ncbi:MAG: SDR family oxidoreductase [Marinibacterium sp.]|nr:SDR family oxidoreductase [Marinibacterium sp.]
MKSIVVTGASSGIGQATAELFLENGWRVGLLARSADKLNALAAQHENAVALPADVTDEASMSAAFDAFGHLDVLFNNAGIFGVAGTIDEVPLESFRDVVNVNLVGMFISAQLAFARFRAQDPQGGRIINNGSISAHVPRDKSISYTSTKHAVTGMTRTLSLDGRAFNIACGQIDIGNARTPMVAEQIERALADGRTPDPSMDVANAASTVLHMANLPLEANVQFVTVMATTMPYIGRG